MQDRHLARPARSNMTLNELRVKFETCSSPPLLRLISTWIRSLSAASTHLSTSSSRAVRQSPSRASRRAIASARPCFADSNYPASSSPAPGMSTSPLPDVSFKTLAYERRSVNRSEIASEYWPPVETRRWQITSLRLWSGCVTAAPEVPRGPELVRRFSFRRGTSLAESTPDSRSIAPLERGVIRCEHRCQDSLSRKKGMLQLCATCRIS